MKYSSSNKRESGEDKHILHALIELGLSLYESRVYETLVEMGEGYIHQITFRSGVPRTKTYHVLKNLEEMGMVELKGVKPLYYSAIPPNEIEIFAGRIEGMKKNLVDIKYGMTNLQSKWKTRPPKKVKRTVHDLQTEKAKRIIRNFMGEITEENIKRLSVDQFVNDAMSTVPSIEEIDSIKKKLLEKIREGKV